MHAESRAPEPSGDGGDRRVLLHGIPWGVYVVLRDAQPPAGVRMTYFRGSLEIMSPGRRQEVAKKQIARLLELFCLERDIPLFGYGSVTMREEKVEAGIEPDECYARGQDKERPDLAIEVVVSTDLLGKLPIYAALGVPEVWRYEDQHAALKAFRVELAAP